MLSGPYVAFAGATWTDRPTVQMLSPAIPCHDHVTDTKMENMLVRHIAALRRAISALDQCCREYEPNRLSIKRNPILPYPTSYKLVDGSRTLLTAVTCSSVISKTRSKTPVCIKFVRQYCKEGHEFLAKRGYAPTLHADERLPRGCIWS
ncbi:LOW QUALITY PROTEIN: hypothetical protein CVT26_005992 [Gymnopilus dilepis]|uniref:Uncharacterized protein n=1 Tax=Gymnopilus dilepis TaxID=231916 RepID=A0A409WFJ3_9AGAR|nr:LOW QUALITY PROTEIN: hypothetical protein CVT26_005992 [Gymnopilus dilepis]